MSRRYSQYGFVDISLLPSVIHRFTIVPAWRYVLASENIAVLVYVLERQVDIIMQQRQPFHNLV